MLSYTYIVELKKIGHRNINTYIELQAKPL